MGVFEGSHVFSKEKKDIKGTIMDADWNICFGGLPILILKTTKLG